MSEIRRYLFELREIKNYQDRFCGNGFLVEKEGRSFLITAAHVVFDMGEPRPLRAISHDGSTVLEDLIFSKIGWIDVAKHTLPEKLEGGLQLGQDSDLVEQTRFTLPYSSYGGFWEEKKEVIITHIGGLTMEKRQGRGLDLHRKYDHTVSLANAEGNHQVAYPGCSGSPLLTQDTKVVGVLIAGMWNKGIQTCRAVIYTKDRFE